MSYERSEQVVASVELGQGITLQALEVTYTRDGEYHSKYTHNTLDGVSDNDIEALAQLAALLKNLPEEGALDLDQEGLELGGSVARHANRLRIFEEQVSRDQLVMGHKPVNAPTSFKYVAPKASPAPQAFVLVPEHKQMTVDVAHRLVAFDCELGQLQAELDNLKENFQVQLDKKQQMIQNRTTELNKLKAEYNVA